MSKEDNRMTFGELRKEYPLIYIKAVNNALNDDVGKNIKFITDDLLLTHAFYYGRAPEDARFWTKVSLKYINSLKKDYPQYFPKPTWAVGTYAVAIDDFYCGYKANMNGEGIIPKGFCDEIQYDWGEGDITTALKNNPAGEWVVRKDKLAWFETKEEAELYSKYILNKVNVAQKDFEEELRKCLDGMSEEEKITHLLTLK